MNQLGKPKRVDFQTKPAGMFTLGSYAIQAADGTVFLAVYEKESDRCCLYRWAGGGDWTSLSVLPGEIKAENIINYTRPEQRWSFDDPARSELVFLMARGAQSPSLVLAAVGYDGTLHSETSLEAPLGYRYFGPEWISRYPNGDYLLYGCAGSEGKAAIRIALDGTVRWQEERPNPPMEWSEQRQSHIPGHAGDMKLAVALADGTALVIVGEKSSSCRLERLGSAGELLNVPEKIQVPSYSAPHIASDGTGLVLEDRQNELLGSLQQRFRYCRRTLDWEWRVQREQTAELCTDDGLSAHTFFPDGVLVGTCEGWRPPCCRVYWLPFDGPAGVLLDVNAVLPDLKVMKPLLDLPALRTTDGTFLFALQEQNTDAKFTLFACAPDGEVLWMKKFSSERWRRIYLRGDELLVLTWGQGKGQDRIRADAFRLPSREEQP